MNEEHCVKQRKNTGGEGGLYECIHHQSPGNYMGNALFVKLIDRYTTQYSFSSSSVSSGKVRHFFYKCEEDFVPVLITLSSFNISGSI